MSVAAISTSLYANSLNNTGVPPHNNVRLRQNIGKLGEDLQAGNLSAAQQDFATLQSASGNNPTGTTASNNPISQAVNQLAEDLQTGGIAAAQQNVASAQSSSLQPTQNGSSGTHLHHHHHGGGGAEASQLLQQLGQDQTSSLSATQPSYSSILQELSFGQDSTQTQGTALSLSA